MKLSFLNTMSRKLEEFKPIDDKNVRMYTCGPTVYNYAHIGNFRAYIFEDLLRRVIKLNGYNLTQTMNLTDVDDKTIRDSQAASMSLNDFTAIYKKAFFDDIDTLKIERAEHYPAATDFIPEMIDMIQGLIDKGFAYQADDKCVYYSINKFDDYGKLAKIDLENQRTGERVKSDEYEKESVSDFALWKAYVPADGDVKWDSPWGEGRPGWHIECSAMSKATLGNHFDLHTGGIDNMFPHHEDEIAQSEACNGCKYVNFWLHCAHLQVNGKKMSKSLGNFHTINELLGHGYKGEEIRWVLIATHYRVGLNFEIDSSTLESKSLQEARTSIARINNFIERVNDKAGDQQSDEISALCKTTRDKFLNGLNDDLNIAEALGAMFEFIRTVNKALDSGSAVGKEEVIDVMKYIDTIFDVMTFEQKNDVPQNIIDLAHERIQARTDKNWGRADEIRDEIAAAGYVVEDSPEGPKVKKA
ncbi:MAG: cysteine--tRNA ligase [Lentisphaeraceae bacterium]|nr:cysteine--tRNA ligase [Lentisphaeraceae bacterium]